MQEDLTIDQLRVFIYEIELQCRFARYRWEEARELAQLADEADPMLSIDRVERTPKQWDKGFAQHRMLHQRFHLAVHDFIIHAANVNKLVFPSGKRKTEGAQHYNFRQRRGEALRKLFDLGATELPHLTSRTIRNDLEHFDERLGAWCREGHGLGIYDLNAMPFGAEAPRFPPEHDRMRHFDGEGRYRFRKGSVDLLGLHRALDGIHQQARKWLENPRRSIDY